MTSAVTEYKTAHSDTALTHFERQMNFETDCWDVHDSLNTDQPDFILVDVRSPDMYSKGHIPGAINIPHGKMIASKMARYPQHKLFVVYCAGPHCNAANKAAIKLARLNLPVKLMIGGITGWLDEGFSLRTEERAIG